MDDRNPVPAIISAQAPEVSEAALTLPAAQEGMIISDAEIRPDAESLAVEIGAPIGAPLPADSIKAESLLTGQENGSTTEEPSQEPIHEPAIAIPALGSGMLLESVGVEKAEKPGAAEEAKAAETQRVRTRN